MKDTSARRPALRTLLLALACGASLLAPAPALAQPKHVLFTQHDRVVQFNAASGDGVHEGTANGKISGVSVVEFRFVVTAPPAFGVDGRVGITDVDGDQIIFRNAGSGRFITAPLADPTRGHQVFGGRIGGPLQGTYEVVAASGKFVNEYPVGRVYPYRGVLYNLGDGLVAGPGAVYIEVLTRAVR